ncbi:hypothetical protein KL86DPRO_10145 [uncultured delta proteobacterium]|uniref:Uncharacterized protein n=1 Tax=uncultured delta proteobacterium TaxID=34034 RepID=A0A212IW39_9DELT|nr:hypothetical protein KL86DPRO_10145 [uncultured delta proteobacterium]
MYPEKAPGCATRSAVHHAPRPVARVLSPPAVRHRTSFRPAARAVRPMTPKSHKQYYNFVS